MDPRKSASFPNLILRSGEFRATKQRKLSGNLRKEFQIKNMLSFFLHSHILPTVSSLQRGCHTVNETSASATALTALTASRAAQSAAECNRHASTGKRLQSAASSDLLTLASFGSFTYSRYDGRWHFCRS